MSDTKHTPGPWYIDPDKPTMVLDGPYASAKEIVAQCGASAKLGIAMHISIASSQANARLISAAPDLLEACRELLRVDDEWHGSVNSEMAHARSMARVAIAKAVEEYQP